MTRRLRSSLLVVVGIAASLVLTSGQQLDDGFARFWGPKYTFPSQAPPLPLISTRMASVPHPGPTDRLHHWNRVAIDTTGLDHTPVGAGESRVFGEQLGPGRASRAMAIVHVAIYDAINSITHRDRGFSGIPDVPASASMDAAIAQAAHDTLIALFPSQRARCDQLLAEDLAAIPDGLDKEMGLATGRRAAQAILARSAVDGSQHRDPLVNVEYRTSRKPGFWRQDPISMIPVALGAYWGKVRPLVIPEATLYRVPPPPPMTSAEYTRAYDEVKRLGGDGVNTFTERTPEQTLIGIYWAYDGTPSLCAPPRLYNQIAVAIADQMGADTVQLAKLLVLMNVAISDSAIAAWESKFYYNVWRPLAGIRESDPGTGPTGLGDGNGATAGDPTFSPLGAPASNLAGPDFTPPFPAYPQAMPYSAVPRSRSSGSSTGPTTSRSRSCRTSSMGKRAAATARFGRSCLGRSRRCRRRRKRTGRAGFTWGSTGRSIRPKEFCRAGRLRARCLQPPRGRGVSLRACRTSPRQLRATP